MYRVIAIYPNLKWHRVTEHDNTPELYEYISGLRMTRTPYAAYEGDEVIEISCGDMEKEELAEYILKNC